MTTRVRRLLWVTKGLGRGGAEQLLVTLAGAMDRADTEIRIAYVLPHKDALVPALADAGIVSHCLGDGRFGQLTWPLRLRRLLHDYRPDVVHTHSPLPAAAARLLADRRTTALVHTEHNVWQRYRRATRWSNAATYGRNAQIFAVSQGVADSIAPGLLTRRCLPPVEVLIHGIDVGAAHVGEVAKQTARARLGLAADAFIVGTVANFTPKKDQDTLLRALALLRRDLPAAQLVLVGGGPREGHLRDVARQLGIAGVVHFAGIRNDVPELLPAFDVFALSSKHEGLSIALIEAMASGVPPVVTAVGGVPEVISHQRNGLLVRSGDAHAFAEQLHRLASDDVLRNRLAVAARDRAAGFGIGPAADRLDECYAALSARLPGSAA
jgi:glycosyltransferase involved in cell wall biosynthesis